MTPNFHGITKSQNGWHWQRPLDRPHLVQDQLQLLYPGTCPSFCQGTCPSVWTSPRMEICTTSLGNLCQGSVVLTVMKCFLMFRWNLLCSSSFPLPLEREEKSYMFSVWYTKKTSMPDANVVYWIYAISLHVSFLSVCFVMLLDLQTHYDFPYTFFILNWQ